MIKMELEKKDLEDKLRNLKKKVYGGNGDKPKTNFEFLLAGARLYTPFYCDSLLVETTKLASLTNPKLKKRIYFATGFTLLSKYVALGRDIWFI
ncbi:hypothetical protein K8R33_04595 [archaeon]|nr:hypothetical protein [archaeon]